MTKIIPINPRGALTLPREVREKLGVKNGGQLIVEVTDSGEITLRPGMIMALEIYSPAQVEAFQKMNEAPLTGKSLRWARPGRTGRTAKAR